ncbi:hypothetical protein ACMA5I_10535 [Paracoccaceae bacterium GXU_MW_L88]
MTFFMLLSTLRTAPFPRSKEAITCPQCASHVRLSHRFPWILKSLMLGLLLMVIFFLMFTPFMMSGTAPPPLLIPLAPIVAFIALLFVMSVIRNRLYKVELLP